MGKIKSWRKDERKEERKGKIRRAEGEKRKQELIRLTDSTARDADAYIN